MENEPVSTSKKTFSPLVFRYFLLLFLVSFLLLGRLFWPFFSILILSFLLSGLFQPVFKFFTLRFKFSEQFSSLVTCFLIVILVFVPLMIFVIALSKEVLGIYPLIKGKNLALMLQQLLAENPDDRGSQLRTNLGLLGVRENVDNTVDRTGRAGRV
jgi:predicted PurR-regulated permease PerM